MRIFGLTITRQKAAAPLPVSDRSRGWWRIFESYTGAWQQNVTVDRESVLTHHAVYACETLIASDICKLRVMLMQQAKGGIWEETSNSAYSPVLRKPNRYQNRIQFWENWILSKLSRGNTYVLKERDSSRKVRALYILDPNRVTPMVTEDGAVFYKLLADNMAGIKEEIMAPASEIIHDRMNCLYHPLIGTSPIIACGVAATQGLAIQNNQTHFFNNQSMPGGILTAPGHIEDATAERLKEAWETKFGGENTGKIAVLGDNLKFEKIALTAVESEIINQLKWTAEVVCSVFHVPTYKIGAGPIPANSNVQSLNLEYYSQALQRLIEDAELCLDEGLDLAETLGTEFDIDNLLRMDSVSQIDFLEKATGIMKLDEQRKRLNLPPLKTGGDTVYLQQQNFSVEALAKRDAQDDPFATSMPRPPAAPTPLPQPDPLALPAPKKDFDRDRDPDRIAKALDEMLAA
jgi:HK97 family phage portal protein